MNLNSIAFFNGNITIYWSGIVIALGILSGFCMMYALYYAHNRKSAFLFIYFPLAVILSIFFCRTIHWYTHIEQYESFASAITNYSGGSYYLQGSLLGVFLAAVIVKGLGFCRDKGELLDALAPGYAISIALIRLSCYFNNSDRGKMAITKNIFKRLPIGAPITDASEEISDWRFATFFIQFILMLILAAILVKFYIVNHNREMKSPCKKTGNVFLLFMTYFGSTELIMDSTRYDASHMHFSFFLKFLNKFFSFISLAQLIAAISMLCILIHYSKASSKANGRMTKRTFIWIIWIVGLLIAGGCEYLVQRFSGMYLPIYIGQSIGCVLMSIGIYMMYSTCVKKQER